MTKLYYKLATIVLGLIATYGIVLPYLVSSKHNELVLCGFLLSVFIPPLVALTVTKAVKTYKQSVEKKGDE